jgi:hypothetical protein
VYVVGAAVVAVVVGTIGAAWAATITTPNTNPFNVPGDAAGNPQSFTIISSPWTTGVDQPEAQQCDGVPHTQSGYQVQDHCDPYQVSGRVDVVGGVATFPAGNGNFGFFPLKGLDNMGRYWCLGPNDPKPSDGRPVYTNCQVRVTLDASNLQASDAWLTMTFPNAPSGTTSTTSTSTSTSTTSTTTTTTTTTSTTTTMPSTTPASMWCGMGAGIPPAPNKNSGLDKIRKGLKSTVDPKKPKDTKHKLTGTADNCTGMPTAPKTGNPISSGSVQVQAEMTPGATCSNIVTGTLVKSKVIVKWNSINPKTLKPKKVETDVSSLVSFEQFSSNPVKFRAVSAPLAASVFFAGKHLEFTFVMDQTQAQLNQACNDPAGEGIVSLTFTNAASFVTAKP